MTRAALAAALIMLLPMTLGAQKASTGRVSGAVMDTQGKALAGATVTIKSETSDLSRTATTDKKGAYRFDNLAFDAYQVTAALPAFVSVTRAAVVSERELNVGRRFFLSAAGGEVVRAPDRGAAPRPPLTVPFLYP